MSKSSDPTKENYPEVAHQLHNQHQLATGSIHIHEKTPLAHASPVHHNTEEPTIILLVEEEIDTAVEDNEMNERRLKFHDKAKRKKFVTNVFIAVGLQLVVCSTFIYACKQSKDLETFSTTPFGQSIAFLAIILWFILVTAIGCCNVGHGKPNLSNCSLLVVSTLLLSVSTAALTIEYGIYAILWGAGTTAGVVIILAMITFFTKLDITNMMIYVVGVILALVGFGGLTLILSACDIITWEAVFHIQTVLTAIGAVVYIVLILIHLQLIVGGGAYEYTEDDWLLASIMLLFDILLFFLTLLGLIRS